MRGMRGKNRHCKWCGSPFTVGLHTGGRLYCSTECRDASQRELTKQYTANSTYYARHREQLRVKPHELTCKRCGGTFLGKGTQCYCMDCLQSGGAYMRKLLENRKAAL